MAKRNPVELEAERRQRRFEGLRNRLKRIEDYISKKVSARQKSIQRLQYYRQVRQNAVAKGRPHKTADARIAVQQRKIATYDVQLRQAKVDRVATVEAVRKAEGEIKGVRQERLYARTVSYSSKKRSKNRQIEVGVWFDAPKEQHPSLSKHIDDIVRAYLREFYNPDFASESDMDDLNVPIEVTAKEYKNESKATIIWLEYTDRANTQNNRMHEKRSVSSVQEMLAYASEMGEKGG